MNSYNTELKLQKKKFEIHQTVFCENHFYAADFKAIFLYSFRTKQIIYLAILFYSFKDIKQSH